MMMGFTDSLFLYAGRSEGLCVDWMDGMEGSGVDRVPRRQSAWSGDDRFAWASANSPPRYRTHEPVSCQAGYHFGGTGVWTGTGLPVVRSSAAPSLRHGMRPAEFRSIWGRGGLYHTICRVGAAHLLLLLPSLFSNELRFASTVDKAGTSSGAAAGLRHRGHGQL